jgi:hypothetical protein
LREQLILAVAGSFDVIVVFLALYYWLLVRDGCERSRAWITVALLAMMRARFLFPDAPAVELIYR